ncbi:neuromedin U, partial [Corallococcus llansteffanensis]
ILNIQPVVPLSLTLDWNLIARVILPVVYQPDAAVESGGTFGLGDTSATFFMAPRKPGFLIWGVGPALLLPTATADVLGTGKWGVGPSVVLLVQPTPLSVGVLANNVWSVFGSGDRPAVNQLLLQYFLTYNLPQGWYVTSAPILTANWKATGDKWVIPFGAGAGKVFTVAGQALNGSVSAYYNVVRPEGSADWQLRVQLAFLFPEGKKKGK